MALALDNLKGWYAIKQREKKRCTYIDIDISNVYLVLVSLFNGTSTLMDYLMPKL